MESSITTVDEVVKAPVVPQPTGPPGGGGCPPFRFHQPGEPPVLMYPGGQTGPGQFSQQHQQHQQPPPLHIYSPGSPPLPLAGPLHLVYLQPSPHGINVIPFQAVGCPTFSPSSPLGFPAHPHHPVVVQSPQLPPHFPSMGPHQPPPQPPDLGPGYPAHHQAFFNPPQFPAQGFYPPQNVQFSPENKEAGTSYSTKPFRPWEDQDSNKLQTDL